MKRETVRVLGIITVGSFLLSGCYTRQPVVTTTGTGEVVVTEAPPAPRQEVIGMAPSTSHVWVQGYWSYRNGHYVWVPGHWEVRPRLNAVWVPGHWDHSSRGWVWFPGHWE